jgi:hypothetical protein
MIDQREAILSRLVVICAAVAGVAATVRNSLDVAKLQRPSIAIFDGAEQFLDAPMHGRGQVVDEVARMELSPLISIHVRANNAVDAGSLLSLYRSRAVAAISTDATLIGYLGSNGRIHYQGATVAPPSPEGNEHRIDLVVVFTYQLSLADLAAP